MDDSFSNLNGKLKPNYFAWAELKTQAEDEVSSQNTNQL